jgi:hypothetical protein
MTKITRETKRELKNFLHSLAKTKKEGSDDRFYVESLIDILEFPEVYTEKINFQEFRNSMRFVPDITAVHPENPAGPALVFIDDFYIDIISDGEEVKYMLVLENDVQTSKNNDIAELDILIKSLYDFYLRA